MAYAKTQCGAIIRVEMKHALRKKGVSVKSNIRNKDLIHLYKAVVKKPIPKCKKK